MRPATRRSPEVTERPFEVESPPNERPPVRVEVAFEVELMIPPVRVMPLLEERPFADTPPVKVEVAPVLFTMRLPPAMVTPPVVIRRSAAVIPAVKEEEAEEVFRSEPAVRVRPFDEERPTVVRPWKVEEAVVEVATRRPNCPTPPWIEAEETMFPMSAGMVEVAVEVR
jgi:hypothetical protein